MSKQHTFLPKRLTAILASGLCFLSFTSLTLAENITVKGSDTMVILGQKWAEVYMKQNKGVTVQVTGGGSGTGIAALINGTTNICQASRPMKDKEKADLKKKRGVNTVEIPVALDGLALFVNAKNPINELTISQLKDIYTGDVTNWKELGGLNQKIILYGRENNSGTYAYFKEHVLENEDFAPRTQTLPGTAAIINAVSKDPKGIGYGGIAYGKGVKHIKIKKDAKSPGYDPSLANVENGSYPISRYLYWYTAGNPQGNVKKLADWVVSPAGQSVVKDVGYYPLPKKTVPVKKHK
jgi:phosphate transport system substrate-binding protein